MYIKCFGFDKKHSLYTIDNKYVKLLSEDNFDYINSELNKGNHVFEIIPKTFYSSPICYLNCLNPVLYIWLFRFFEHDTKMQKNIYKTNICFEISEKSQNNVGVEFLQNTNGSIKCINKIGIKKNPIITVKKDLVQSERRKITYILTSVLYMIFFNVLSVIDAVESKNVQESILFCFMITLFSFILIFRINRYFSK